MLSFKETSILNNECCKRPHLMMVFLISNQISTPLLLIHYTEVFPPRYAYFSVHFADNISLPFYCVPPRILLFDVRLVV